MSKLSYRHPKQCKAPVLLVVAMA